MAIYQRGRIWYLDYYLNGKRVQESSGTSSKRTALKMYTLRSGEAAEEAGKPPRISLSEFGEQYLAYAKANKRSWLRDEQIMVHLKAAFGPKALSDIGPLLIERYKLDRLVKVAPATVNREIALLKHLFNLAEQWELYRGRNPVRGVKFLAEDNLMVRYLSTEEEERLMTCCPPYLQDIVKFAINTGLRLGEILNLRWEEVDLDDAMLSMMVRKTRKRLELPMTEEAVRVVKAWHGMKRGQWVFYNPETGERWKDIWHGLKKACRSANLPDVTWHTFRHTFASRLTRAGVDLVTVKELLGHATLTTTLRYAHTSREAKRRAVNRLSDK